MNKENLQKQLSDKRIQNEIEHGKYLIQHGAGEIWNWETPAGRLRWKRRVQMLTSHITPEMEVLEIGCGTGYFTKELVKTGANIHAIDISDELLRYAESDIKTDNVRFIIENAYDMSFENNCFNSIIGSSVLHYLDVDLALSEFYRVLKSGGSVFFTEPNMLNPHIFIQKNIPYLKNKLGDSPDETAFFRYFLEKKLKSKGFFHIKIEPFDFLHPWIPEFFIPVMQSLCELAEKIPAFREIGGSLYIRAVKP